MHKDIKLQAVLVGWYALILVAIAVALMVINMLTGFSSSSGATVAGIFAAAVPGDVFYRRTGMLPSKSFSWRMALLFTLANLVVSLLPVLAFGPGTGGAAFADPAFWIIVLLIHGIVLIGLRFAFSWGASSRQKAMEKKAQDRG